MDSKRVEELKHIRDDLEIYGAKCELVRRANTGNVYFDKDIYGMFGSIGETEARFLARGITFALHNLVVDDGIDHGPVREADPEFVNPGDWACKFWKHNYLITVTAQGTQFFVNAEYEGAALAELVDFCEDRYPGLVSDGADLDEDDREEYFCGGNYGLYLTTNHIQIKEL
jgi:hypothetical protein